MRRWTIIEILFFKSTMSALPNLLNPTISCPSTSSVGPIKDFSQKTFTCKIFFPKQNFDNPLFIVSTSGNSGIVHILYHRGSPLVYSRSFLVKLTINSFSVGLLSAIRSANAVNALSEIFVSPFSVKWQSLIVRNIINSSEPIRLFPS